MLTITDHAERTFRQTLDSWHHARTPGRVLHFRFSTCDQRHSITPELLATALQNEIDDPSLQAFFFTNGDVLLLAETIRFRSYETIVARFSDLLIWPIASLAMLHDIERSYSPLRALAEAQIAAQEAVTQEVQIAKAQENSARRKQDILRSPLRAELIATLAERRRNRDRVTVMVIEDDAFSRKLVGKALPETYALVLSDGGDNTLPLYVTQAPDVLFLDINLPDVNGFELLARLREIDPDAYIVMLSGNGDRANIMRAVEMGAKGFVGKPFTRLKLEESIQRSPHLRAKQTV
jgi:two-component system chemotaxis response regulator CheY